MMPRHAASFAARLHSCGLRCRLDVKECPRHFTVHSTLDDHALELMGPRLSTTTLVNSDKDYKFNDARWNEILSVNPDASYLIKGDHAISNSGGVYETHVFAVLELPVATTVYLAVSHSMGFGTRDLNTLPGFTGWEKYATGSLFSDQSEGAEAAAAAEGDVYFKHVPCGTYKVGLAVAKLRRSAVLTCASNCRDCCGRTLWWPIGPSAIGRSSITSPGARSSMCSSATLPTPPRRRPSSCRCRMWMSRT